MTQLPWNDGAFSATWGEFTEFRGDFEALHNVKSTTELGNLQNGTEYTLW